MLTHLVLVGNANLIIRKREIVVLMHMFLRQKFLVMLTPLALAGSVMLPIIKIIIIPVLDYLLILLLTHLALAGNVILVMKKVAIVVLKRYIFLLMLTHMVLVGNVILAIQKLTIIVLKMTNYI